MRALAVAASLAMVLAGCISSSQQPLAPAGGVGEVQTLVVHRGTSFLPTSAEQVLGKVPHAVEKLLGTRGGEPNIGVTSKGSIFITSGDFVMKSTDKGETWTAAYEFGSVHPPANPLVAADPIRNFDPMLWVDPVTDRIFAPFMFPALACSEGLWSDDDGASWQDRPLDCGLPGIDHQKLATGPYVSGSTLPKIGLADYPNVVYFCYNDVKAQEMQQGSATRCAVSTDGGMTFPMDNTVAGSPCGGINGHPAAAPNGTVFVPFGFDCGLAMVGISDDNGQSWRTVQIHTGGLGMEELDPEITVTPDGTSYYFFRAASDHLVYYMRSHDAFANNEGPFLVSPPDVKSTRFVAMTSGDDGKIAFAYLGTRDSSSAPSDAVDQTRWYLFETFTRDAAAPEPTFVTIQVSPANDPVQVGYMWETGGGDPARNLLDFIDMVHDQDGRVYVAFTDGCTGTCVEAFQAGNVTKSQSRARNTSLAYLVEGPMLLSAPALPVTSASFRDAAPALPGIAGRGAQSR